MKRIVIEEKTLQLALVKAASQFGVTQDEIAHCIIEEKSGFLGFIGRKVSIEAWKKMGSIAKRPRFEKPARSIVRQEPLIPMSREEMLEASHQATEFCKTLLAKMYAHTIAVESKLVGGSLNINILDKELADQFLKSTKIAESMEHLLRKVPTASREGERLELPFRIFVDANHVRKTREDELVGMAQELSDKVHANKKPVSLNYKSSYDRKVIHMALDNDTRVYTKSVGSGSNRKLMIFPNNNHG